ncbi:MAG: MarP family serine protease [Candidatus Nanopelagicales bacterium]|nr:MarP family serine protease [Candidatus Nanopelagicales bacterium]
MNPVDLVLLVGVLLVGYAGWRAGVIATVAAFAGFLAGALAGAWLVPRLLVNAEWPPLLEGAATVAGMLVLGMVGQAVLGSVGRALRGALDLTPLRLLDSASGMVVSAVAFLLSAWLVLSVVVSMPSTTAADAVAGSRTFPVLEQVMAGPGGDLLADARGLLADLELPSLPFNPATLPPVEEPGEGVLTDAAVEVARESVVQVATSSDRCAVTSMGSGLVVAPGRVATNAHVVTGADRITVRGAGLRGARAATAVLVDPRTDVAILAVPGLDAPAPAWARSVQRGTDAAIAGHPGGGRLTIRAARVRGTASIAEDGGPGVREVVVLQGLVQPGNSGGPVLDPRGRVLGLVFANSSVDERTGFALAAEEVLPAVERTRDASEPVSTGACPAGG